MIHPNIPELLADPSLARSLYERIQSVSSGQGVGGISDKVAHYVRIVMEGSSAEAIEMLRFQAESPPPLNGGGELKEFLWNIAKQANIYTSNLTEKDYDRAVGILFEQAPPAVEKRGARNSILTWAYTRLQEFETPARCRDLILALLETFYPLSQRLIAFKHRVLDDLVNERCAHQAEFVQTLRLSEQEWTEDHKEILTDSRDDIRSLDKEISELAGADLWKSLELLQAVSGFKAQVLVAA
ncbi:MAG: hypothetical protein ACD_28C00110G0001 [uncultured bacterium]|nr:MAG: hypothetical protein ACD_28C00110G0001 [uncultured bacterium]KKT76289.1 MAG: hypothetical protein UW70_C0019G0007 [Candidatus Peregrinibacteria bacterium GW2011_GWA2_44_7]